MADLWCAVNGPRDGRPVVLLHGFPFDHAMWRLQVGPLTAAGYRVVAPDLTGFGKSDGAVAASMDAYAADVQAALARLRIGRFVLAGFSMGGYVALALAARMADRLDGFVMIDSKAEADSEEGRKKRDAHIAQVQAHGIRALHVALLESQLTPETRQRERLLADEVRAMMLRQPKAAVVGALQAMRDRPDRMDVVRALPCPLLALAGSEDKVTPMAAAQAMAAAAKDGEAHAIAGAAHLSPMEQPDDANARLLDWLSRKAPAQVA